MWLPPHPTLPFIGRSLPTTQREEREREGKASLKGEGRGRVEADSHVK